MENIWNRRSIEITGLAVFLTVTGINAVSSTPIIYILTVTSFILLIYSAKKFKNQFGVKLFFRTREEGRNYWGVALSGVYALLVAMYIGNMNASFTEKVAMMAAIVILALLVSTLMYGSILADIRDGGLNLENIR